MKCKSKNCNRESEQDGFCEVHYWQDHWLDNSDKNNLGIVLFAKMIVPEWVRDETPRFHLDMYRDFIDLYNPSHRDKYDRLLAEVAFRGGAKTTLSKILLLYICCFAKELKEKLVVYASETYDFAEQDVFEVRRELTSNAHILHYFGLIKSKGVKGQDGEWCRGAFLTTTGVYVLARGVGQQVRGVLRNSWRATTAIINDIYSENNTKTEYTRNEVEKWFFTAMMNGVDDIVGKVFFNGTILHEDTVPIKIKQNETWKYHEYPIMDLDDFERVLKSCDKTESKIKLPSDEIIYDLQKTCKMFWPQRLDLRYILRKFKESYENGKSAGFYQEYFHLTTPDEELPFRYIKYAGMTYIRAKARNFLKVNYGDGNEVTHEVNIYAGVDPASATTLASKYTAIVYIAMNSERQVFVMGYARGKFGMRDELRPGYRKAGDAEIVEPERSNLSRIGMVDETIRLVKQLHILGVKVETVQQQQSVFDEINRLMRKNNAFHQLFSVKPHEKKEERDAETLMPLFQTGSIFINYGLGELEHELKQFPRGTTVDIIDALQMAVSIARPSDGVELEEHRRRESYQQEEDPSDMFYVL